MHDEVALSFELHQDNICLAVFARQAVEEARAYVINRSWTSGERSFLAGLLDLGDVEPLVRWSGTDGDSAVFYLSGCLVLLELYWSNVTLRIAGEHPDVFDVDRRVRSFLPQAGDDQSVNVTFWYWAADRGTVRRTTRVLKVPEWSEIENNYPHPTRERVATLVERGLTPDAGQLLLWFGEPGCGKTYALRALLRAWRDRYSIHYISDAENFFAKSDYLLSVLLEDAHGTQKLLILEDAGEFLLPDARHQMGQGLSRLLNASDGLIGQGLESVFLITTNEEVGRLHPAVSRPGRCAAQIEFGSFSRPEAIKWLEHAGAPADNLPSETRLADLYAICRGDSKVRIPAKVGF